mgnify:CR=1 FL=1
MADWSAGVSVTHGEYSADGEENENGEIVGVVVSTLNARYFYENESIIPQNVNFAIKGSYVSNLISILPEYQENCHVVYNAIPKNNNERHQSKDYSEHIDCPKNNDIS